MCELDRYEEEIKINNNKFVRYKLTSCKNLECQIHACVNMFSMRID